jgi:hypothetical protein
VANRVARKRRVESTVELETVHRSGVHAVPAGLRVTLAQLLAPQDAPLRSRVLYGWAALSFALGVLARYAIHLRSAAVTLLGPDGHRALTSADAYYYATGIKRAAEGWLAGYERVPTQGESLLVALGATAARLWHSSDVAYFFPIAVGPLALLTVLAWGRALALPRVALLALLPVALGYSYLYRTGPGQFDTDTFALTVPYLALAASAGALRSSDGKLATLAGVLTACSGYAHPGAERILLVASLGVLAVVLASHRTRAGGHVLLALALGLAPIPMLARLALIGALQLELWRGSWFERARWIPGACALVAVACVAALQLDTTILTGGTEHSALRFYDVRPEVAELRGLTFSAMAERVSGGVVLLALSSVGLLALCIVRPEAWLLMPLFVLGTLGAQQRGLRFTMYAVPAAALGLAWLAERVVHRRRWALPLALAALAVPAVVQALPIRMPATYREAELALMGELARHARPGDYALAWWDQAYGLWYYAGVRTLVDGMKQDEDLFVVAEALYGEDQRTSAKLARLAVERQEAAGVKRPAIRALFAEAERAGMKPDAFLGALAAAPMPVRTREIHLFLPSRVAAMTSTWARARVIEGVPSRSERAVGKLELGRAPASPLRGRLKLKSGHVLDLDRWLLLGRSAQPLADTLELRADASGRIEVQVERHHDHAQLHLLHLRNANTLLVADDVMLHSNYLQLAAFGRADPHAFSLVAAIPNGALFRLVP